MMLPQARSNTSGSIPTFAELEKEFQDTLGFIRNDLRWLIKHEGRVNYTVALLVGYGFEMLAACREPTSRLGEKVFMELMPEGDWQVLAKRLYTALRDGLAHGFDTRHIMVDSKEHQISFHWDETQVIRILPNGFGIGRTHRPAGRGGSTVHADHRLRGHVENQ
jgi:hypothetical protein